MGKRFGWLSLVLGLVIGALIVWFVAPRVPTITWGVVVGPLPSQVSVPDLPISGQDRVHWTSYDRSKLLYIEFEQQIFQNMTQQSNGRYRVICNLYYCDSGAVLTTTKDGTYKYWQGLADSQSPGTPQWADGRIIIKW